MRQTLINTLARINRPGKFCISGDLPMIMPGLDVTGLGLLSLPIKDRQAQELISLCLQAPYGKGTQTLVDTNVRKTWELDSSQFRCTNPGWDEMIDGLLDHICEAFGFQISGLEAHPYKLLVYEKDGFFLPHRDGEKLDGMVATLTVALPSIHTGGALIVSHEDKQQTIAFDGAAAGFELSYAAFFADCEHEIKPIESGIRLCLTYNLTVANGAQRIAAPSYSTETNDLSRALSGWHNPDQTSKIAILLDHRYTQNSLSVDVLKGVDRARAEVIFDAAEQANCVAHLALVTLWQFGAAEGDDDYHHDWFDEYRYRDGSEKSASHEMGEIFDDYLSADHWSDRLGVKYEFGPIPLRDDEIVSDSLLDDGNPTEEEYEGYTGNAGMTLERWYHRAALVIWPRNAHYSVLCEAGTTAAIAALVPMVEQLGSESESARKSSKADCKELAHAIIDTWNVNELDSSESHAAAIQRNRIVTALSALDDTDLMCRFLEEVVALDGTVELDASFTEFCQRRGWRDLETTLVDIVGMSSAQTLTRNAKLVEHLGLARNQCDAQQALCERLCGELLSVIIGLDSKPPERGFRKYQPRRREYLLASVRSMLAIGTTKSLSTLVDHVTGHPNLYKPAGSQLRVLFSLEPEIDAMTEPNGPMLRWLSTCRAELEALTSNPPVKPTGFNRAQNLPCDCEDCTQLSEFLADRKQAEIRMALNKERRKHLHRIIDDNKCDLTHVTERTGSPYKLVCTKTEDSYRRAVRAHRQYLQNLSGIERLEKRAAG